MKTIKLLISALVITFFSSCYFLDYVIPEEYFAENQINKTYPEFVWVSHISGIQCGMTYFSSLENAVLSLKKFGIKVYDSKIFNHVNCCDCGKPTGTVYWAKIKGKDLNKAIWDGWRYSQPLRNN